MSSAAGYQLAKELLGRKGDLKFESLGEAADYVTEYSTLINSDVNVMLSAVSMAAGEKNIYDLKTAMFIKKPACTKEKMAEWLIDIGKSLNFANDLLKIANSTISKLQSASIRDKETIIKLQEEVISMKTGQLQSAKTAVQSEIKNCCDIVEKSCRETVISQEKLTKAVVEDRGKNLMVFGLKEEKEEDLPVKVKELLNCVSETLCVRDCVRIGTASDNSASRPVKIIMRSSESVQQILRQAGKLKVSENFRAVFFSPDRTHEEQTAHQLLVLQMKEKIKSDPIELKNGTTMSKVRHPKLKD